VIYRHASVYSQPNSPHRNDAKNLAQDIQRIGKVPAHPQQLGGGQPPLSWGADPMNPNVCVNSIVIVSLELMPSLFPNRESRFAWGAIALSDHLLESELYRQYIH
jgi:hypothetical protein